MNQTDTEQLNKIVSHCFGKILKLYGELNTAQGYRAGVLRRKIVRAEVSLKRLQKHTYYTKDKN